MPLPRRCDLRLRRLPASVLLRKRHACFADHTPLPATAYRTQWLGLLGTADMRWMKGRFVEFSAARRGTALGRKPTDLAAAMTVSFRGLVGFTLLKAQIPDSNAAMLCRYKSRRPPVRRFKRLKFYLFSWLRGQDLNL